MKFSDVVERARALLQRTGKVTYRVLKREFSLDDEALKDLCEQFIDAEGVAADQDGKMLVWVGARSHEARVPQQDFPLAEPPPAVPTSDPNLPPLDAAAERRQLTVMFCDVVGSTALSTQLDPEELREVMHAFQQACVTVVARFEGHVAKALGDGLLVYFGFPTAHEDDAARAVRAGLGIIEAVTHLALPRLPVSSPLRVRVGIHTGLVVVGEMGGGGYREPFAIVGTTPNVAARLQEFAAPNSLVISDATARLVSGQFVYQELGLQSFRGLPTPLAVYHILQESEAPSRFDVVMQTGLTPLVGREQEMEVLRDRWELSKAGNGQVVLLSGEPGIGKSRLGQALKEQAIRERATRVEFRCSPYYQNTALYPVIAHLQRLLKSQREDTPQTRLGRLKQLLGQYRFPQEDTLPLLAALLVLPHPEDFPPLDLTPQQQRQRTHDTLFAWMHEEAERQAVLCTWEDLHWADPSTLELLQRFITEVPRMRLMAVLTFRPAFTPPWKESADFTSLELARLEPLRTEAMVMQLTRGKSLPPEVMRQIIAKTDGVPLFVEELTKMVLESWFLHDVGDRYELRGPLPPLAIPSTLQDSLMARLDRLASVRELAQLGAVLGREFTYELLKGVSLQDEKSIQQGLKQLVEVGIMSQDGVAPHTTYLFKHALVQEAAYQSLLKSSRQHYHYRVAHVLETQIPEMVETQPELIAHHYTEAGLGAESIRYWLQAGRRAEQRSALAEAIHHLTKGLNVLKTQPETPARDQQELQLCTMLGPLLMALKGYSAPEVEGTYARALALCNHIGETPRLFHVLVGLTLYYLARGQLQTARQLGERCFSLAEHEGKPLRRLQAHVLLANLSFYQGEFAQAEQHLQVGITLYQTVQSQVPPESLLDPGIQALPTLLAWTLWCRGYPDSASHKSKDALATAEQGERPLSRAIAAVFAAGVQKLCRNEDAVLRYSTQAVAIATAQGFPLWRAYGMIMQGWALGQQGLHAQGIAHIQEGISNTQTMGAELVHSWFLLMLAETYVQAELVTEGLATVEDALRRAQDSGERAFVAELYRLKGELTLQKGIRDGELRTGSPSLRSQSLKPQAAIELEQEVEGYFLTAIEIARTQSAKSWELRASISLARLWRQQGKRASAHKLLLEIYERFTEGFAMKDLQEAARLLGDSSASSPTLVGGKSRDPID